MDGKAPTRVPFHTQGRRFDPGSLRVQQYGTKWAVTENGRHLFDCANAEEGETLVRVVKAFGFDQVCHIGPSQRITPLEALALYTTGGAYASGEQGRKGRLMPGYLADFVVLGADPTTAPHDEIAAIPVRATYVGGQRVWSS